MLVQGRVQVLVQGRVRGWVQRMTRAGVGANMGAEICMVMDSKREHAWLGVAW